MNRSPWLGQVSLRRRFIGQVPPAPEARCEDLGLLSKLSYEDVQNWRSKGFILFYVNGDLGNEHVFACNSARVQPPTTPPNRPIPGQPLSQKGFCETISPLSKPDYDKIKSFQGAQGIFWVVPAAKMAASEPYIVWCNLFATQSEGSVRWDPTTPLPSSPTIPAGPAAPLIVPPAPPAPSAFPTTIVLVGGGIAAAAALLTLAGRPMDRSPWLGQVPLR
jgi:hypothetical protein